MTRLFLRPSDIRILENVKNTQSGTTYQQIKDAYGKAKTHKITVEEYANYRGVPVDKVKQALGFK